jgi:hypothetical protein
LLHPSAEVLWLGIWDHFQADFVDGENVGIAFLRLQVVLELEAVDEQILVHGVQFVDGVLLVGFGLNVKTILLDPVGAFDLAFRDAEHEGDHQSDGFALGGVAVATGGGLDRAKWSISLGGPDGGYLEFKVCLFGRWQTWGLGYAVAVRDRRMRLSEFTMCSRLFSVYEVYGMRNYKQPAHLS